MIDWRVGHFRNVMPAGASISALVISGIVFHLLGVDVPAVAMDILKDSFGSRFALAETLVKATPIAFCAFAVALPGWCGLVNIGAEGQFLIGATAAAGITLAFPSMGAAPMIFWMAVTAAVSGAAWAGIAGCFRARFNLAEALPALMLNFVAELLVEHLVHGPWRDPASHNWPYSAVFPSAARLQALWGTRLHFGILVAMLITLPLWLLANRSSVGFQWRIFRANERTASFVGLGGGHLVMWAMCAGGAIAAVGGMVEVSAVHGRLQGGLSGGIGYTGFLTSWVCRHNPWAILPTALLFAGLLSGGDSIQIRHGLPAASVNVVFGILLFAVVIFDGGPRNRGGFQQL